MSSKDYDLTTYMERRKRKQELQHYWVSFAMMIGFTLLAFWAVSVKSLSTNFKSFFIIILAVVQVIYQLYYFMHLKDKEHGFPSIFIFSGALVALLTVITFLTIIWVG